MPDREPCPIPNLDDRQSTPPPLAADAKASKILVSKSVNHYPGKVGMAQVGMGIRRRNAEATGFPNPRNYGYAKMRIYAIS
jgi:hypothetical protein